MAKSVHESEIFRHLDELYLPTLSNMDIPHPRLMILFSGAPSTGKSTVARKIEIEFKGLRLENDAIRILLVKLYPNLDSEIRANITYTYSLHLWNLLIKTTVDGLWINDCSIDRRYKDFYNFARKNKFATFLIAMNIAEDVHRRWILQNGDRPFSSVSNYLKNMESRRQQQRDFLSNHTPDLILNEDYDIAKVLNLAQTKLKTLS